MAENKLEIQISKSETNSKFKCFKDINKDNPIASKIGTILIICFRVI